LRSEIRGLEDRIRLLEKLETDRVLVVRQEMAKRESEYHDLIRELRDEHERYRNDTAKEIAIHEALGKKHTAYQEVLRKELIIA
jgi:cell division septum initiation protein DivIVA